MNITLFDLKSYFGVELNITPEYYEHLRLLLTIKKVVGKNFVRIGNPHDGGYILVDNFHTADEKIAYSFGIANDVSWDSDMARHGYDVFMYDPTIDALQQENDKFHFFKEGIGGEEDTEKSLNTLEHFMKVNGHKDKDNMILKMDVEGAEWDFFKTVSSETLNKFDQMVFEVHLLIRSKTQIEQSRALSYFNKINRTHSLVHVHANNDSAVLIMDNKILFPDFLELTYVKTSNYELVDDENIFLPIPIDRPNNKQLREIPLGFWNKKFNNVVNVT